MVLYNILHLRTMKVHQEKLNTIKLHIKQKCVPYDIYLFELQPFWLFFYDVTADLVDL